MLSAPAWLRQVLSCEGLDPTFNASRDARSRRSRLAGECAGLANGNSSDRTRSPASRLLQITWQDSRCVLSAPAWLRQVLSCKGLDPTFNASPDARSRRSRLAGESAVSANGNLSDRTRSPASRLLQVAWRGSRWVLSEPEWLRQVRPCEGVCSTFNASPDARSVGAGLLAKASCQQMKVYLTERVRQQAGTAKRKIAIRET